jgi:peptide deformylase
MSVLKIVTAPNQILTAPNKPIAIFDDRLKKIVTDMEETLIHQTDPEGVGLAAPQVGLNLQIFIMKPTPTAETEAFVNPRIVKSISSTPGVLKSDKKPKTNESKKKKKTPLEGCLSIPKIWGPVRRNNKLLLEYQTVTGQKKQSWFSGFKAVIVQHECDHLNGILFTQRSLEQKAPLYEEKEDELVKVEY